jgi:hypothetical protein
MFFIFPIFSLWCAGYTITHRSTPALNVALLVYLPYAIFAGSPLCWLAWFLLMGLLFPWSPRLHWFLYGLAVALTVADVYVKLLSH